MDFVSQFKSFEVKAITLESCKGKPVDKIYLRGLSRSDVSEFRELVWLRKQRKSKVVISSLSGEEQTQEEIKSILNDVRDEDYLIIKCLCDRSGKLLFENSEDLRKEFLDYVPNDVCNEILYHIDKMNTLNGDCPQKVKDQQEEEQKKNGNAS